MCRGQVLRSPIFIFVSGKTVYRVFLFSYFVVDGVRAMSWDEFRSIHLAKCEMGTGGTVCLLCGKVLHSHLKRHYEELHTPALCRYRCPVCSGSYEKKRYFLKHISSQHPELKGLDISRCTEPLH